LREKQIFNFKYDGFTGAQASEATDSGKCSVEVARRLVVCHGVKNRHELLDVGNYLVANFV
jgi:hypothetical protein